MRIEGPANRVSAKSKSGTRNSTGAVFRPAEAEAQSRAQSTSAASASTGIDALLALQSVEDATTRKRRQVRRGHDMLDMLEGIKADLVVGRVSEGKLNTLIGLVRLARERTDDKRLDALIEDIELRARVELAKLGR